MTAEEMFECESLESKLVQVFSMYYMTKGTFMGDDVLEGIGVGFAPLLLEEYGATFEKVVTQPNVGVVFYTDIGERGCLFLDRADYTYCLNTF